MCEFSHCYKVSLNSRLLNLGECLEKHLDRVFIFYVLALCL